MYTAADYRLYYYRRSTVPVVLVVHTALSLFPSIDCQLSYASSLSKRVEKVTSPPKSGPTTAAELRDGIFLYQTDAIQAQKFVDLNVIW